MRWIIIKLFYCSLLQNVKGIKTQNTPNISNLH